jgi:hypothetical protein
MVGSGIRTSSVSEGVPVPRTLIAATVTVYEVPFTRPIRVHDNADVEQSVRDTVGAVFEVATSA